MGCTSLAELSNLRSRVQDAGYTGVSVEHNTSNGFDTLAVAAYAADRGTDDGEKIFRLVWETYPEDVDRVVVVVNDKARAASKEELRKAYGPRKFQPAGGSGSGTVLLWVLFAAFLVVCGLIAAEIVRRRRRRRVERVVPPRPPGPYYKF
ncbi:hypothetical protein ACRAKJ_14410 [Saccharothrix sp. DSM 118769]